MCGLLLSLVFALASAPPAEEKGPPNDATPATEEVEAAPDEGAESDEDGASPEDNASAEAEAAPPEPEPAPPQVPPKPLRVAVAGSAPFVIAEGEQLTGLSIRFWNAVVARLERPAELELVDSIPDALAGIRHGTYDVAVGPISITADRARSVTFSQPYYESPLSIASTRESSSTWQRIRPFFTRAFIFGVGTLLLVLALVGVVLWLTERRENKEQFSAHPVHGIGAGVWLALVTMTTVGYGDKAPVTVAGRVVAGAWMVLAMLIASSLTASIATALTLSQLGGGSIRTAEDLSGEAIAVVGGSPAEAFARRHGARLVPLSSIPAALDAVDRGDAVAVVHDRAVLEYELQQRDGDAFVLAPGKYDPRGYGFAIPLDSEFLPELDRAVLEVKESGLMSELAD